jgi:hypothetical protein
MPPSQLEHLLIELGIALKISVLEQLLTELVVRGEYKAREDSTEFADLVDNALGFRKPKPKGIYFVGVFADGECSLDESEVFALFVCEAQRDVAASLDIPVAYRRIEGRLVTKELCGNVHGLVFSI